jgi:transcriptional regulator with XRE-family HTH domain
MTLPTSTTEQRRLNALLKKLRLDGGHSQHDVAVKLGQPQSFVSRYESGERRLDVLELRAICRVLGTTLTDFIARFERGER